MKKTEGRTEGRTRSAGAHPGALMTSDIALWSVSVGQRRRRRTKEEDEEEEDEEEGIIGEERGN